MPLLPSGLAGSSSQEEGASLTWTGGHTTGEGEREGNITLGHICQPLTERREGECGVLVCTHATSTTVMYVYVHYAYGSM